MPITFTDLRRKSNSYALSLGISDSGLKGNNARDPEARIRKLDDIDSYSGLAADRKEMVRRRVFDEVTAMDGFVSGKMRPDALRPIVDRIVDKLNRDGTV